MKTLLCDVKDLVDNGYDEFGIQHELGLPTRRYATLLVRLSKLPQFVQNEYEILVDGGKTNAQWEQIANLYKAYNREYRDYPLGNGPRFTELWHSTI